MTSAEIYAYAERNTVFLSDHGVCAGSKSMIVEFLNVFVDGKPIEGAETIELDTPIQAALADLEPAFDYGLHALQAYAVVFSLWPTMSRTYEQLLALIEAWPGEASDLFKSFRERLRQIVRFHRTSTRLGTEVQRVSHERVFADMYTKCAIMPGSPSLDATLSASMTPAIEARDAKDRLRDVLRRRFCEVAHPESPDLEPIVTVLMDYVHREQAIVRTACQIQERINCLLGRTTPMRPLTATDLAVHYRLVALHYRPEELQGIGGRLPYLIDDLEESLGLNIVVSSDHIQILDRAAV